RRREVAGALADVRAAAQVGPARVQAGLLEASGPRGRAVALVAGAVLGDAEAAAVWPSTFSSGTSQSSNTSSAVSEPRMPILSSFCAVENPFIPFSIRNAEIPRGPAFGSVLA